MKKEDVIKKLFDLLSKMHWHASFKKELQAIILGKSGCEERIFSDLLTQLKMLAKLGININRYNSNEILKQSGGLYSLHMKCGTKYNIRILLKFKGSVPYLLCAFEEDGKKRKDGSGYKKNIEIANKRYNNML